MKVSKDGKLKLPKDERQVGSFVYKDEPEHVKIMDINSSMSVRLPKTAFMSGRLLDMQLKRKETVFLHNYAAMCYNLLGVLPDEEFMVEVNNAATARVNRHKEFYGIKEDITSEQDKEILEESKKVYEAIEELKKEETNEDSK